MTRRFYKEMEPKEMIKSECFYTRFDEDWKVMKKIYNKKV